VLLDIDIPSLGRFEASRQIKKDRPKTKILFLTMGDDEDYFAPKARVTLIELT
jgi:two-component system response regulator NreC